MKMAAACLTLALLGAFAVPSFGENKAADAAGALFEKKCSACHPSDRPKSTKKTADEWASTVKRMRGNGCKLTDEEAKDIVDHLAKNYGK